WTDRFVNPSSLIGNDIHIEGPQGLLDHVAVRQELEIQDIDEKTIPDGYLQTITLKPGVQNAEIRVHLDNLAIVALARVTILERVRPCSALVTASGNAYFVEKESGTEERGENVRIEGPIVR